MESGSGDVTYYGEANYYELLEVDREASLYQIEEAYRQQMELLSGDSLATYGLFVGEDLVHARSRVEEAYRVLSNPERRRAYDLAEFDASVVPEDEARVAALKSTSAAEAAEALLADAMGGAEAAVADAPAPDLEDAPEPDTEAPSAEAAREGKPGAKPAGRGPAAPPPSVAFGTMGGEAPGDGEAVEAAEPAKPVKSATSAESAKPSGKERSLPKVPGWKSGGTGEAAKSAAPEPAASAPRKKEVPSLDIQAFDGLSLKAAREQQGISRQDISHATRIAEYYIEYIEEERFSNLPPAIYLKAYLRQYAEAIGANPEKTVAGYLERYNASKG